MMLVCELAIAACFPGSFAAVANLATFDQVDDVFVCNILITVVFIVVVRGIIHFLPRGHSGDSILKRPILLSHDSDLGGTAELVTVLIQKCNQAIKVHFVGSVVLCVSNGLRDSREYTDAMGSTEHQANIGVILEI
jgi:hypothetical protein